MNNGEGGEVEIKEEKVFEVKQMPLFSTRATGHYQQNRRSQRLNYTIGVEQAICFRRKGPSYSDVIDSVDYDGLGQVNRTHSRSTSLMSNIPWLP